MWRLNRPLIRRGSLLSVVILATSACSYQPVQDGAPPGSGFDPSKIREPVPRAEPPSRYGNPPSYVVHGRRYAVMESAQGYQARGTASWYGTKFHGRRTSSGEPYDMYAMTAAHKTLPLPTYVRVTNLHNGRSAIVRINDRGPFVKNRLIDLSYAAALKLGVVGTGTAPVEVRAIDARPYTGRARADARAVAVSLGPTSAGLELYLQVGAFAEQANAERLRARLHRMDLRHVAIERGEHNDAPIYRVRIGPLSSAAEADRLVRMLSAMGLAQPHVVDN